MNIEKIKKYLKKLDVKVKDGDIVESLQKCEPFKVIMEVESHTTEWNISKNETYITLKCRFWNGQKAFYDQIKILYK